MMPCATENTVVLPPTTRAIRITAVALTAGAFVRIRQPMRRSCTSCSSVVDTQTARVFSFASAMLPNARRAAVAASAAGRPRSD